MKKNPKYDIIRDNVSPEKERYKISNGNGMYLNYNNTTSVTYGNNEANATEWIIGNDGKIYCYVNNNYYYLIGGNNDQLSLSTNAASATVWTYNNFEKKTTNSAINETVSLNNYNCITKSIIKKIKDNNNNVPSKSTSIILDSIRDE